MTQNHSNSHLPRLPARMLRGSSFFLAIIATIVALATTAHAEDDSGLLEDDEIEWMLEDANQHANARRYRKAIPIYKKILRARPDQFPSIYYNLAEIHKFLDQCSEAILLYERYLVLAPKAPDRGTIKQQINNCKRKLGKFGQLQFAIVPAEQYIIFINDIPAAVNTSPKFALKRGKYDVAIRAENHEAFLSKIEVGSGDDRKVDVELKKLTFYGNLSVTIDVDGAEVKVDGKSMGKAPLNESKLEAGKHYIEINKDGYHRWVRNIHLGKGETYELNVKLQRLDN